MNWTVTYRKFNQDDHPLHEALCTLGNGYFATRGALEMFTNKVGNDTDLSNESAPGDFLLSKTWNYPGTYLAGGYNRLKSEIQDKVIENEDLVNWPNWLCLSFSINGGAWFDVNEFVIIDYTTRLHLKDGVLERNIHARDAAGHEFLLLSRRFVGMDDPHIAALHWTITPLNWSGELKIRSGIDGGIINNNVERYSDLNQKHIDVISKGSIGDDGVFLVAKSRQSQVLMAQSAATRFYVSEKSFAASQTDMEGSDFIAKEYAIQCNRKVPFVVEKMVALYTSRDCAISDPLTEAKEKLGRLGRYAELEGRHKTAWHHIWAHNDIEVDSVDPDDQLLLRLHIFHLYQTVSYHTMNSDVGIPARGWHGEAYRGHVFWDELYVMPFINLRYPQLSRSLLMYRYNRISKARHAAREAGFKGAMFPWQSGSNGREETQKIHLNPKSGRWLQDVSHLQYHINAAIPYNVWHYYQCSCDANFLLSHGAEMILSAALFWSGIATWNPEKDKYEILRVMGPDEYHTHYPDDDQPGLNNNAYTNIMAVWVIIRALDILALFDESSCKQMQEKLGFHADEVQRWQDMAQKMYVPITEDQIILQFDGYDALKELDWKHYRKKYGKALRLDRILESEGDSCNRYKASKQADVLMLFYLFSVEELTDVFVRLGYNFDPAKIPDNIEYYRKRTAHGSTLSQVIHAWVYARSHRKESWKRFREALMSDFKDVQGGTTHEGIHLGAMAGTLDLIQRCYSGMDIREDVLWFNPRLPEDVKRIRYNIRYRSHWIHIDIDHQKIRIVFDREKAEPVHIGVNGIVSQYQTDDKVTISYNNKSQ